MHAYIGYTSNQVLNQPNNHATLADKYVTPMAKYLISYFGMEIEHAYSLAWGGLADASAFANAADGFEFTMYNGGKITKAEINSISADYKDQSTSPIFKGTALCQ